MSSMFIVVYDKLGDVTYSVVKGIDSDELRKLVRHECVFTIVDEEGVVVCDTSDGQSFKGLPDVSKIEVVDFRDILELKWIPTEELGRLHE